MRCRECDADLMADAGFCHRCGAPIRTESETISPRQQFQAAAAGVQDTDDEPEQELWQGRFSKLAMSGSWIAAAVISLAFLLTAWIGNFGATGWTVSLVALLVIWLGLVAYLFYRRLSEHYFLTNRRFVHEKGLLWRETDRIEAIDIDDVSFQQGPVGRFLGVGTIRISSSDQTHPTMELLGIENVREVAGMIDEARRQERRKRGLHIEAV